MESIELRLSMQRALWGEVTPGMRCVSGEADQARNLVLLCFVFEAEPSDTDKECAGSIAAEVTGDLQSGWKLEEVYLVIPPPNVAQRLKELAFLRYEPN